MSHRRFTRSQAVALAALVLQAGGSTGWHTVPGVSPAELIEQRHPTRLRVELLSGGRVELRDPVLRGDSLIGLAGRDTVRIAASDVATAAQAPLQREPHRGAGLASASERCSGWRCSAARRTPADTRLGRRVSPVEASPERPPR